MKSTLTFPAHSRSLPLLLLALGLVPLGSLGCSSTTTPSLAITSLNKNETWKQEFTQACMSRDANGDFDVVLIDRATEQSMNGSPMTDPVRQVMHIRILWSPNRDMKAVVTNACVKWYVIGQSQGTLEYSGVAFVAMEEDEGGATLKLRNAMLTPSGKVCQLSDWIGPSRVEGKFVARADRETVNRVLTGVKTALARTPTTAPAPVASTGGNAER